MAGDQLSRGIIPRHDQYDDSHYPPLPSEEDERLKANGAPTRSQMASGAVTLPSIQDRPDMYGQPGTRSSWDPRTSGYGPSPNSTSGYPPPGSAPVPPPGSYSPAVGANPYPAPGVPHQPYSLPPVQQHAQDHRGNFAGDPRSQPYYSPQTSAPYSGSASVYDYNYRQDHGPRPAYPAPDYARGGPAAGAVVSHGQSAPRQRTSIACKYCRRRKIRCSGYANSPGGKCTNCFKMNQECVFQPVSSTSSTAFVPVSALPNGVPPGVQLFGAYGQPLAGQPNYPPPGSNYQASTPQQFDQPLPSPTGSNSSYWEDRSESGRRRQRMQEEEHGVRLPPPGPYAEDSARRRSPSSSSPSHLQPFQTSQPQPIPHHGFDSRTPPRGSPSAATGTSSSGTSVMNLENIITPSANDIDKNMLGRLNRRAK